MPTPLVPSPSHPIAQAASGRLTTPWYTFLWQLRQAVAEVTGGGAPSDAGYVLDAPDASLPNARVLTDSLTVDFDASTAGVMKAHVLVDPAGALDGGPLVPLGVRVDGVTVTINGSNQLVAAGGGDHVPLALGTEPLTFVSDGAGSPILVPFTDT